MKALYIIKAGSTFAATAAKHGDFEEMTLRGLDVTRDQVRVTRAYAGEPLPEPVRCAGVVITGAHCMVTDNLPWSLELEGWIRTLVATEVPLLGICYGHQLMGRALGGQVGNHPHGKEVGTFTIRLRPESRTDRLLAHLPREFPAHTTHTQSVLTLPHGAVLLAENAFEPHHAFRVGPNAWGVQFHPEYDSRIMRDYIEAQANVLAKAGQDVDALLMALRETPEAASILRQFARIAGF